MSRKNLGEIMNTPVNHMSLDSNVMKDKVGNSLPHFTPVPSPESSGVNLFAKDLMFPAPHLYWLDQY